MKAAVLLLTQTAEIDIASAVHYYNEKSPSLGLRFADSLDHYFTKIVEVPSASAIRYKNVRVKSMNTFPFIITYTFDDESSSVIVLRVFNTNKYPSW